MDLVGYDQCSECKNWVPSLLIKPFGGICPECAALGLVPEPGREVLLRIDGRDLRLSAPSRRSGSRGSRETRNKREKAKRAAERRLARLYPTIYRVLLAQERAARGLDPYPPGSPYAEGDLMAEIDAIEILEMDPPYPCLVIEASNGSS